MGPSSNDHRIVVVADLRQHRVASRLLPILLRKLHNVLTTGGECEVIAVVPSASTRVSTAAAAAVASGKTTTTTTTTDASVTAADNDDNFCPHVKETMAYDPMKRKLTPTIYIAERKQDILYDAAVSAASTASTAAPPAAEEESSSKKKMHDRRRQRRHHKKKRKRSNNNADEESSSSSSSSSSSLLSSAEEEDEDEKDEPDNSSWRERYMRLKEVYEKRQGDDSHRFVQAMKDAPFVDSEGRIFDDGDGENERRHRLYFHDFKVWQVPRNYKFPSVYLREAWNLWLAGDPENEEEEEEEAPPSRGTGGRRKKKNAAPIRPFRELRSARMPQPCRHQWLVGYKPILSIMEKAPGLEPIPAAPTAEYLASSFARAFGYLKTHRLSYAFETAGKDGPKYSPGQWKVATWSRYCRRSMVEQFGTDSDKANLPPVTSKREGRRLTPGLKRKKRTKNTSTEGVASCASNRKSNSTTTATTGRCDDGDYYSANDQLLPGEGNTTGEEEKQPEENKVVVL